VTVFFGTLVAGSIASQIKVFVEQPATFLQTLGTAAPMTSIFFLTYVETNVRPRWVLSGPPALAASCLHAAAHCLHADRPALLGRLFRCIWASEAAERALLGRDARSYMGACSHA
jgi:hypothetical protein